MAQWQNLLEMLVKEHEEHGIDLVVFDPLLAFLPCSESDSTALRRLLGFSRFPETPRELRAELNVAGDNYRVVFDRDVSDDFSAAWDTSPPS